MPQTLTIFFLFDPLMAHRGDIHEKQKVEKQGGCVFFVIDCTTSLGPPGEVNRLQIQDRTSLTYLYKICIQTFK